MIYGRPIILMLIILITPSVVRTETSMDTTQASTTVASSITRDWKYHAQNEERKKKRAHWRKGLFSTNKKNSEKITAKRNKKIHVNNIHKTVQNRLHDSHSCLGRIHHNKAQALYKSICKHRAQIKIIEDEIKQLKARESNRLAHTSKEAKEQALLAARRAETIADQKDQDYRCARIHNSVPHPEITRLKQELTDLRFKIKTDYRKLNSLRSCASDHYAKAGKNNYLREVNLQLRDQAVIEGKSHKRTRMRLDESKEDWEHKQEIEQLRQRAEKNRRAEKAEQRIEKQKQKMLKRKNKQKLRETPKLSIVIQKKKA